jgi:hypothetical protein
MQDPSQPGFGLGREKTIYDGKRMRKAIVRKVVDPLSNYLKFLQERKLQPPASLSDIEPKPEFIVDVSCVGVQRCLLKRIC